MTSKTAKIVVVRLFDQEAEAWHVLKDAGYAPSAILRKQLTEFARSKGLLPQNGEEKGEGDGGSDEK